MIDRQQITEIVNIYEKHGWTFRRVLLSGEVKEAVKDLFASVPIIESDIDAAWFTRSATPGRETWEIRHLSVNPFALLSVIELSSPDAERETILAETEARLRDAVKRKPDKS